MKDFWFIGFVLSVVSRSVIEKKLIFEPLYTFLLKLNSAGSTFVLKVPPNIYFY